MNDQPGTIDDSVHVFRHRQLTFKEVFAMSSRRVSFLALAALYVVSLAAVLVPPWQGVLGLSIGFAAIASFLHYSVLRHLIAAAAAVKNLSATMDLTRRLREVGPDEARELSAALNSLLERLDQALLGIAENAQGLVHQFMSVTLSTIEISRGAETQSARLQSIASASEEMSTTIAEISKDTGSISEAAKNASALSQQGAGIVDDTVRKMTDIADRVRESSETVTNLGHSSDRIGEIIGVIADIADQTNLLALNAAIEAARAGDQGRGFAVVADEVRKLAERTSKATREIADTIRMIQRNTAEAVESMKLGVNEVGAGAELTGSTREALGEIARHVTDVADQITRIATTTREQSVTTEEVVAQLDEISQITDRTTKEVVGISENMDGALKTLNTLRNPVAIFYVGPRALLGQAKIDHLFWVHRLRRMLNGKESIQASELTDHRGCRLGKWYYGSQHGELFNEASRAALFRSIESPHAELHRIAATVIDRFNHGDAEAAKEAFAKVEAASKEIVQSLDELRQKT